MTTHHLIVGDGAAGASAVRAIRQRDAGARITLVSADPNPAYYRAALTNYLLGKLDASRIFAFPPSYYAEQRVERIHGRVGAVDFDARTATLEDGRELGWDRLLIATGAKARPAPFAGGTQPGVLCLRSLRDAGAVVDRVARADLRHAALVGGGPLALELAEGLLHQAATRERLLHVRIILRGDRFLRGALDREANELLHARLRHHGVEVDRNTTVQQATPGPTGGVESLLLSDGRTVPCGLLTVAIGVQCNVDMLRGQPAALGPGGGAVVDDEMRLLGRDGRPVLDAFAAGDVAEHRDGLLQLWEPARQQGLVAGANMTGQRRQWAPGAHYFATRLFDLDFAAIGDSTAEPDAADVFIARTGATSGSQSFSYRKLVFRDARLTGALLLGEKHQQLRRRGRLFKRLIDSGVDVSSVRDRLLRPEFDLRRWVAERAPSAADGDAGDAPTVVLVPPSATASRLAAPAPAPAPVRQGGPASALGRAALESAPTELLGPQTASARLDGDVSFDLNDSPTGFLLGSDDLPSASGALASGRLDAGGVSQRHAHIVYDQGRYWIQDLGSQGGTFVDGALVTAPLPLSPGAQIQLGTTRFRFVTDGTAPDSEEWMLRIDQGVLAGTWWALRTSTCTLGSSHTADLQFTEEGISREHGRLAGSGTNWHYTDLGSTNSSSLAGRWLAPNEPALVGDGDSLDLGGAVLSIGAPRTLGLAQSSGPWSVRVGGRTLVVPPRGLVLGRREAEGVVGLDDRAVSSRHLRLEPSPFGLLATDLQSRNGTTCRGVPLRSSALLLRPDVELVLAERVPLRLGGGEA